MDYSSLPSDELLRLCIAVSDTGAWREFVRRFSPVLFRTVRRILNRWNLATPANVEDQVQAVFLKICEKQILQNLSRSDNVQIEAFLTTVTANQVSDYVKALHAERRGSGRQTVSLDGEGAPSLPSAGVGSAAEMEKIVFFREIEDLLRTALPAQNRERDLMIFSLYYHTGLTAPEIASIPVFGLGVKGVESIIQRINKVIKHKMSGREH